MDLYFDRCDGTATTIEVFLQCFAVTSGRDLTQFARWYHQSGTPEVGVDISYDETSGILTLDMTQTCPPTPGQRDKDPFVIPLAFGLVAPGGGPVPTVSADLSDEEAARGRIILATATVAYASRDSRSVQCRRCCAASRRRSGSRPT